MHHSIQRILEGQHGLSEASNYHEFCRLLSRLKSNYQLSELMKTENFTEWLGYVAKFPMNSLISSGHSLPW